MWQRSGVFLILNCLSGATFFRQTSSWFLTSLLTLSTGLSGRGREKKNEAPGGGEKVQKQIGTEGWEWDIKGLDAEGGMSERSRVSVSVSGLRGQGLHRLLSAAGTTAGVVEHRGVGQSALLHCSLSAEENASAFLFLTPSLTQSSLTSYLAGENRACSLLSP